MRTLKVLGLSVPDALRFVRGGLVSTREVMSLCAARGLLATCISCIGNDVLPGACRANVFGHVLLYTYRVHSHVQVQKLSELMDYLGTHNEGSHALPHLSPATSALADKRIPQLGREKSAEPLHAKSVTNKQTYEYQLPQLTCTKMQQNTQICTQSRTHPYTHTCTHTHTLITPAHAGGCKSHTYDADKRLVNDHPCVHRNGFHCQGAAAVRLHQTLELDEDICPPRVVLA